MEIVQFLGAVETDKNWPTYKMLGCDWSSVFVFVDRILRIVAVNNLLY